MENSTKSLRLPISPHNYILTNHHINHKHATYDIYLYIDNISWYGVMYICIIIEFMHIFPPQNSHQAPPRHPRTCVVLASSWSWSVASSRSSAPCPWHPTPMFPRQRGSNFWNSEKLGNRRGTYYILHNIYIYLDNPPVQNYRSKSETAINIAGCLNVRRFQFFSPLQFPHFRLLICFAVSSGFFAVSLGFFAVSKPANACKMTNIQKLFGGRKTCRQQ